MMFLINKIMINIFDIKVCSIYLWVISSGKVKEVLLLYPGGYKAGHDSSHYTTRLRPGKESWKK